MDIKLFEPGTFVKECVSSEAVLERELQNTIEQNMKFFLASDFLKVKYAGADTIRQKANIAKQFGKCCKLADNIRPYIPSSHEMWANPA